MQAVAGELGELEDLTADERRAEQRRRHEPDPRTPQIAALQRGEREHHRQRAHQQDERGDRRERDVEDLARPGSLLVGMAPIQEVGGDEGAEEEAVGGEEDPDRQLWAGDAGRRRVSGRMLGVPAVFRGRPLGQNRRGRSLVDVGHRVARLLGRRHGVLTLRPPVRSPTP